MVIVSAVGLGFLVVFLLGAAITFFLLKAFAPKSGDFYFRSVRQRPWSQDGLSEKARERIAIGGGILAVLLLIYTLMTLPIKTVVIIWGVLTVIGVIFGISTFFWNRPHGSASSHSSEPQGSKQSTWRAQEWPAGKHTPTDQNVPPVKKDYYRELMAKVRYDQAVAERLIAYERKRMPLASLDELCRSAIERLERDNRQV